MTRSVRTVRRDGGSAAGAPPAQAAAAPTRHAVFIVLFFLILLQPFYFTVASVVLHPYRILLLVLIGPALLRWLRGDVGRQLWTDRLMIAYALWILVSMTIAAGGFSRLAFQLSQVLETLGAYFLARAYIRSRADFLFYAKCFLIAVACLLPFLTLETFRDINLFQRLYANLPAITVYGDVEYPARLGLERAQGPLEHPILMGILCAMPFALAWQGLRGGGAGTMQRLFWAGISTAGAFLSLSAAALLSVLVQGGLLGWDTILKTIRERWLLLILSVTTFLTAVGLYAGHNPILVLVSRLTFSANTALNRVRIWRYGTDTVAQHPIFGIGDGTWDRPAWMGGSVDNFWLVVALRYGVPGIALLGAAILTLCIGVARQDLSQRRDVADCRTAWLVAIFATGLAMATVNFWGACYVMFMFLLGAGAWIAEVHNAAAERPADTAGSGRRGSARAAAARPRPGYTRFPPGTGPAEGGRPRPGRPSRYRS